jgi:type IV pilus assembly protein PilB
MTDQAPIIRMANAMMSTAIDSGASDMYIEPAKHRVIFRCRIDGQMQEIMMMPKYIQPPLIRRFKVMANMDVATDKRSQIGTIPITHNDYLYTFRTSVVPTYWGECISIHIFDLRPASFNNGDNLGFYLETQKQVEKLFHQSRGLVLLADPKRCYGLRNRSSRRIGRGTCQKD